MRLSLRTVLLLVASALLVLHARRFSFVSDDAFITFRYAQNLVEHGSPVFNLGERVEGYSNFLWMMVLAAGMKIGLDPVPLSQWLGIAAAVLVLWRAASMSAWIGGRPSLIDVVAPFCLALSPAFACWSSGGLETQWFTLFVTLGWASYLCDCACRSRERGLAGDPHRGEASTATGREPRGRWTRLSPACGIWFALASLTRPEGLLLFAAVMLHRFLNGVLVHRSQSLLQDWRCCAGFFSLFVPFLAWRWSYYGHPLPNTFYVKGEGALWSQGFASVRSWLVDHWILAAGVLALFPPWVRRSGGWVGNLGQEMSASASHGGTVSASIAKSSVAGSPDQRSNLSWRIDGSRRAAVLLVFLAGVLCLHVARVGGDFMALHRFLVPILPALALCTGMGAGAWMERWGRSGARWVAPACLLVVLGLCYAIHADRIDRRALEVRHDPSLRIDSIGLIRRYAESWSDVGRWLKDNSAAGTSIAVEAAGAIPYYSGLPAVDILGLNDEWIAHHVESSATRPGHSKRAPPEYLLERKVDRLIFHPALGPEPPPPRPDPAYWRAHGYLWKTVPLSAQPPLHFGFWERVK